MTGIGQTYDFPMIDENCRAIIEALNIDVFVETGTHMGETVSLISGWFAELHPEFGRISGYQDTPGAWYESREKLEYPIFETVAPSRYRVHSIDLDQRARDRAAALFASNPNIHLHLGSSERVLRQMISEGEITPADRPLFYLDAHWGKNLPLKAELEAITRLERAVVVVDDFAVPGRSDPGRPHGSFGFDIYGGEILSWGMIRQRFAVRNNVRVFYPTRPNRDGRGWVAIFMGYSQRELEFLTALPLFELAPGDPAHAEPMQPSFRTYLDWRNLMKEVIPLRLLSYVLHGVQRIIRG